MRVYVSGPLSGENQAEERLNVLCASEVAARLIERGHTVFLPHLYWYLDRNARSCGIEIPYEAGMAQDLAWLECCDVLLWLGPSPGADRERTFAERLGIGIFLRLEDLP